MSNPVDEFLQMKEKQAGFLSNLGKAMRGLGQAFKGGLAQETLKADTTLTMGQALARGAGQALLPAAVTAAAAGIATGASRGIGAVMDRFGKAKDYQAMMQVHPTLRDKDPGQAQLYFNSLRSTAPTLAKDPLVAGSFVRNMMELQPSEGPAVPLATTKLLADAQKSLSQARGGRGPIAEAFMTGRSPMFEMPRQQPERPQLVGERRFGPIPGEKIYEEGKIVGQKPSTWGPVGETVKDYG
jgi:hypothetical protein